MADPPDLNTRFPDAIYAGMVAGMSHLRLLPRLACNQLENEAPMSTRTIARLLLALILAGNGVVMLFVPSLWYQLIPGVTGTGPLNAHFVRDIGCAYLCAGAAFAWLSRDSRAWPAALTGSAFLLLHALVHVGEATTGTFSMSHFLRDLPGVFLLPLAALWLAWPGRQVYSADVHPRAGVSIVPASPGGKH